MHTIACKEFYTNLTMYHYKKKEVSRSRVRGVEIEFDSMRLTSIHGVHSNNGICEYIKEVWEESKYIKPLEITRKFANDEMITAARRFKSNEMKPFQRFLHFMVMKNVIPRFRKRDTTSFMDLTYMDHLSMRRLVNLSRVMMRHMSYVISVKDHELPYEEVQNDIDWEAVHEEAEIQGESGSAEKFYDAEDEVQGSEDVIEEAQMCLHKLQLSRRKQHLQESTPRLPLAAFQIQFSIHYKQNLRELGIIEFKKSWTELKQKMHDS
ncbi:hypothetical protein Dimus_031901 [Dionaea muscipula]